MCGQISITHHDHIVFIIFEFNDETLIMHINTLYFSYMKPALINVSWQMHKFVNLSFLENGRGGLYMYLYHAGYKFFVRTKYNPRTYCTICFNNYFVVMILNNGMMIWIKNISKKSFFCQTKGFLHGEKILVQYTYNGKKYISM